MLAAGLAVVERTIEIAATTVLLDCRGRQTAEMDQGILTMALVAGTIDLPGQETC